MGRHTPKYVARQRLIQRGGWPTKELTPTVASDEDARPAALVAKQANYCRLCLPLQRVWML